MLKRKVSRHLTSNESENLIYDDARFIAMSHISANAGNDSGRPCVGEPLGEGSTPAHNPRAAITHRFRLIWPLPKAWIHTAEDPTRTRSIAETYLFLFLLPFEAVHQCVERGLLNRFSIKGFYALFPPSKF